MEKLKPILAGLKKHHFWIVCVVAVGVFLGGWYMAWAELPEEYKKNKAEVEKWFAKLKEVDIRPPVGQSWPQEAANKTKELHEKLEAGAKRLKVSNAWIKGMGPDIANKAESLGRAGNWPPELLEKFQKNLPAAVDELLVVAQADTAPKEGKVLWDEAAFKQFRKEFEWNQLPVPAVMYEAQEKLWVARPFLLTVAAMNGLDGAADRGDVAKDKTDKWNLPISAIEVFQVGTTALVNRPVRGVEGVPAAAVPNPPGPPPAPGPVAGRPRPGAPAPPPPPVAPPVAKAYPGLRPYPVLMRLKMNPNLLGSFLGTLLNQRGALIIVDDVLIKNVTKERRPVVAAAAPEGPAPGPPGGPPVPGGPAPRAPARPGAAGAVPGPMAPGPMAPMAPGPGGPEEPPAAPAAPEGPPHLVQVPRDSIVEIQATAYFVDTAQLEALKK